jgi:hypothetical protein
MVALMGHNNCKYHEHNRVNREPAPTAFAWLQLGHDAEDVELSDATERVNLRYAEDDGFAYFGTMCLVDATFAFDGDAFELVDCRETVNPGHEENVAFTCEVPAPGEVKIVVWKTDGGTFGNLDHELMKTEFAILTETPGDYPVSGLAFYGLALDIGGGCTVPVPAAHLAVSENVWRAQ